MMRRNRILFTAIGLTLLIGSLSFGQDQVNTFDSEPVVASVAIPPQELPGHREGARNPPEPEEVEDLETSEWFGGEPWWTWSRATGDWGGFRTRMESTGVTLEGSYTFEWSGVWSGGVSHQASHRHLLDFNLTLDLESVFGTPVGTVFADFYSTAGDPASSDAGDIQGFSNIETESSVDQIAELWYELWLFEDVLRFKIGKVDANTEFAFVNAGGEFINSSAGFNPSIFVLPTYPDGATSVNIFVYPRNGLYFGAGLYDGASGVDGVATGRRGPKTFFDDELSSDYFLIGEGGATWELDNLGPGRAAIGGWFHSGDFTRFDGGTDDGTGGIYIVAEQQIWDRSPEDDDDSQGIIAFFQYGYADDDVSAIAHHIAGGLSMTGTFTGRENDAVGIYLSHVLLSDEPGAGFDGDETALELFYKIQLTPFVSIKPDLQLIFNPSGDKTLDDAIVGGIRFEITF